MSSVPTTAVVHAPEVDLEELTSVLNAHEAAHDNAHRPVDDGAIQAGLDLQVDPLA